MIYIFIGVLIFVAIVFTLMNTAIKDRKFVCNKYILNTYLYVILSFIIIGLHVLILEANKIVFAPKLGLFLLIFLLLLILIGIIHYIPPENLILKHLVWGIFMILLATIFYPVYLMTSGQNIIPSAILTTLVLFILLSLVAYVNPDIISFKAGPILLALLVIVIILELSMIFFARGKVSWLWRGVSYFVIILFSVYIIYDTKRLQHNAKQCVRADYITESLNLFLDIYNIFIRILTLRFR